MVNSKARLIAKTASVIDEVPSTATELIAYVARVSNPEGQANSENSRGLLDFLQRNDHWSPFEMYNLVIEVETPRDIARQILRHRSCSFQEFSQRYADPTQALSFCLREARLQDPKNRQSSIPTDDTKLIKGWIAQQKRVKDVALSAYTWARERSIAKECARVVLPEGLTMSNMYINGNLRSWIHYVALRESNGTQLEHQEIAILIGEILQEVLSE